VAVQIEEVECHHHDLDRTTLEFILQNCEIGGAVGCGRNNLAIDDRGAGADVPGIGGDLFETVGPIVAAPRENLHPVVGKLHLHTIAVELVFMDPARAARSLLDRGCQRRFDEAGERRFAADRRGLLTLERHALDQAYRKRKLDVVIATFVSLDETFQIKRNVAHLKIATVPYLMGYIGGDVLRPAFTGIEADHADGVAVLPLQHSHDDRFEVRPPDICFSIGAADRPEIIHDDVDRVVVVIRDDRRRPAGITHRRSTQQNLGTQSNLAQTVPEVVGEFSAAGCCGSRS
jgi:hypothetical protein